MFEVCFGYLFELDLSKSFAPLVLACSKLNWKANSIKLDCNMFENNFLACDYCQA